jgi:cobalt-zinc-cadmium efflux system membrane fusion protein
MTRALIIMATLAIGVTIGAASQISPSVRTMMAATGLIGPQSSEGSAAPTPTITAPHGVGDDEQKGADGVLKMPPERIEAAEIRVAPVSRGELTRKLTVPGTVAPNADRVARVPAKVVGTVTELRKRLGDPVKQGEVVAVVSSREVADAKSEYLTASVNFELQKTMFERAQILWNKRVSAEQQYLQARATFDQAQLRFDLARQKLSSLNIDANELANAAKKDATSPGTLNLRRYEIPSPISGRVVERMVDQGTSVGQEGEPSALYTVADLSSVWAELAVPTADLDQIKEGQRVLITSGGKRGEGRIIFVSPLLNPETRSARVIAEVDNKTLSWRPGSFVMAEVVVGAEPAEMVVSRDSLEIIGGEQVAFVRIAEGFQRRNLKIGKADDQVVEVVAGLSPNDRIATSNTFLLKAELGKTPAERDD